MMTPDDIRKMVLSGPASGPGFDVLRAQLAADTKVDEIGQGHLPVREALATFTLRERTAARAGRPVDGLGELLSQLSTMDAKEEILLFHFGTASHLSTVFVHEASRRMVGCISAPRREASGEGQ